MHARVGHRKRGKNAWKLAVLLLHRRLGDSPVTALRSADYSMCSLFGERQSSFNALGLKTANLRRLRKSAKSSESRGSAFGSCRTSRSRSCAARGKLDQIRHSVE